VLQSLLAQHEDLRHLQVKVRGTTLLVVAHEQHGEEPVARLTPVGRGQYGLSIFWHNGKWQRMPVVGGLVEIVEGLHQDFAFMLQAL